MQSILRDRHASYGGKQTKGGVFLLTSFSLLKKKQGANRRNHKTHAPMQLWASQSTYNQLIV